MTSSMLPVYLLISFLSSCPAAQIVLLTDNSNEVNQLESSWKNLSVITNHEADITVTALDVQETESFASIIQYLCGNFHEGETIIVDLSPSCLTANVLASTFQPFIRPTYTGCYCAHASNLLPEHDPIIVTAIEFIKRQRTTLAKIIIIADTCQYSPLVLDTVQSAIPLYTADLKTANISQWLAKFKPETIRHYVILVGTTFEINKVLCAAKRLGLPMTFTWLVHMLDNQDYSSVSCPPSQLFTITPSRGGPRNENSQHVEPFINILPSFWPWLDKIFISKTDTSQSTGTICQDNYSRHAFDFPVFQHGLYEFDLKQNFPSNGTSLKVGKWSATDGLTLYLTQNEHEIKDLLVVTLHEPPFVYIKETDNGTVYSGYAIDVLDKIVKRLGLNYRIYTVSDGKYGRQKANGDWNGLVGEIVKGAADIAVAPLSVTTEREGVVDFTIPFYDFAGIQIMMKRPDASASFMAFTFVLSQTVWVAWFMVLLLTVISIYIYERFSPYSPRNSPGVFYIILQKLEKEFNISECFWFVIASVAFRGPECTPRTLSTRILITGFWFFSAIMMANYIANFAAVLTTSRLTVQIESLKDLASQSDIKYSLVEGTTIQDYFERMAALEMNFYEMWRNMSYTTNIGSNQQSLAVFDYPLGDPFQTINTNIMKTGLLKSSQEGLKKVLSENFAMIHESPMLQYELNQDCRLMAVGKQFSTKYYAFALPQRSVLTRLISKTILDMQSGVIFDSLKENWWKGNNSGQDCTTVDESDGLTFSTMGGIFLVMVFGIGLGLLVLLIEILYYSLFILKRTSEKTISTHNSRTNLAEEFYSISSNNTQNIETCDL